MQPIDFIIIAIIAIIIGGAAGYIIKAKKNGKKCIGCPYECSCQAKGNGSCGSKTTGEEN